MVSSDETNTEIRRLRARARRAEAALEQVHQEQENSPWFVRGTGPADPECPYHGLIDNLDALVVFIDADEIIRHANSYTAEYLGMQRSDIEGRSVRDLLHTIVAPGPGHDRTVDDLLADPTAQRTDEVDVIRPDGTVGCVSWARRPVRDPDGTLLGVVAVGTDITARRDAQRQDAVYQEALRSLTSELALAEERQRRTIATRIHEEISQNLAYAKLRVGSLSGCTDANGCEKTIEELNDLLDSAIAGTRALAFELSPPMLHELGFSEAIEWLAEQFEETHDITCHFSDDRESRDLPPEVSVTLFRAVAELLDNIAEHAGAASASIEIDAENGTVEVRVADDGRGFDPTEVLQRACCNHGFGLFNIRERLRHLGGRMSIESTPLTGTEVTLVAPRTDGAR